ncbi:structural protein [Cellulophaga phage phi4:1]|uniref:Structural protein n=3 Tax=Lightbulbvirus Cba41 TaxID=1918524 RepID=A0A0S2MWE8_9CAUD|nr:virion structural protein [Cellulophaga phage phi4:1]AGO49455.1 structural protein [Cellulophaga phage phi4:1]ALO80051.1 structural protein [Cellulophaga phage phi4:1_13]ALO80248.1 structural protein [Cellulophaga phage phi4:1_18]
MAQKQEVNSPVVGMNRGANISAMKPQEYSFALNVNFQNDVGEESVLKLEASNLLATEFKSGYKVVGFKNDITTNATYFFLTNPTTGISEFGRIKDNQTLPFLGDEEEVECSSCDKRIKLSEPLEEQTQVAIQLYETLLEDSCNKCLNLNIDKPIKSHNIQIKNEKCGNSLYFTDAYNVYRYIQLDNLDIYSYTGDISCGEDNTTPVCLDCDKLRVFRLYSEADLIPEEILLGGSLPLGTYEFLMAYSDNLGNELSEYFAITSPIYIFNENDNILEQQDLNKVTNFSIKVKVESLDTTFKYYKVVVIQNTSLDGAIKYVEEGIHSTTDNSILYTTDKGKTETSINSIFRVRPNILTLKGITQANNYLIGYGTEVEKEWNLQPIVNLLGSFLKWQTHITTEEYYKKGVVEKGYMRDEVVPFSIRFHTNTGYKTALKPLVSRPAETEDLLQVNNLDSQSINNGGTICNSELRDKKWQFYNTAKEEGYCSLSEEVEVNIITEETERNCTVSNAVSVSSGRFTITDIEDFVSIEDTINEILETGNCQSVVFSFCSQLNLDSTPNCTPNFENCTSPSLINQYFKIGSINNPVETLNYKNFPEEYRKLSPNSYCEPYATDNEGNNVTDTEFKEQYVPAILVGPITLASKNVYSKNFIFTNDKPNYAESLVFLGESSQQLATNYYNEHFGGTTDISSIQLEDFNVSCSSSIFSVKVHESSLWFEVDIKDKEDFILEVTKLVKTSKTDMWNDSTESRISVFDNPYSGTSLYCDIFNNSEGHQVLVEKTSSGLKFKQSTAEAGTSSTTVSTKLYIAVEAPYSTNTKGAQYTIKPANGCYGVGVRDIELKSLTVDYSGISFDKVQTYVADCDFNVPVVDDCSLIPSKFGSFAYWESTEEYPDNPELYDSSNLVITEEDIPSSIREDFESKFTSYSSNGTYKLKGSTNLTCTPIRHFKFPDNAVSPFIYNSNQVGFSSAIIYPLGVTIDETVINAFLDLAVKNNLVTQEQRDSIVSYEIFRGDRSIDKSIIAKGLMYDMYEYEEKNKTILYSNYPYNDLGEDILNYKDSNRNSLIPHPYGGSKNHNFTLHTPETDYQRPTLPTELKVESYMFGKSRGATDEVEDHPKWVILGSEATKLASKLATAETLSEAALNVASAYSGNNLFFGGLATGGTFAGIIFASIAAGFQVFDSILFKYGRYKYEWLKTFRNLGTPQNFANYYSSVGDYNYIKNIQTEGNLLRSINVGKYLKDGKKILIDNVNAEEIQINNIKREDSVFLSFGKDYPLNYSSEYQNYDNNKDNQSQASRFYSSETNNCQTGRSEEAIRNIASPYVALKNYLPAQYGPIDSVKWLSTSYKGDLLRPKNTCLPIFGGDVFISRHSLKRKMPLFLRDAFDLESLIPFNYKFYGNIGEEPRYFCNYEVPNKTNIDKGFPSIESEYNFDCLTGSRDFYIEPPTKFYLYYYGVVNFLTETTINTNFRYGKKEPENNFYPNVGDYMDWTQEKKVSIRARNTFFYNFNYSKNITTSLYRTLPATYSKKEYDCRYDEPNGGIYSLQDNSENDLSDPWLTFRPLDKFSFSSSNGELTEIRGIENDQILVRFTDTMEVHNAVDTTVDDGSRPEVDILGNGGLFSRRTRDFSKTDLGKYGSQHSEMSSNEFGHFFTDCKRGSIIQVMPSSQGVKEISKFGSQNRPNGMFNWFKEHLPFKILKSKVVNYEEINTDNAYNGIGLTVGYDDRYKRVFFTKKDYNPLKDMTYDGGSFYKLEGYEDIISQYITDGFTYEGIEGGQLKFTKETSGITESTDIYATFDTTSMQPTDGISASIALNAWFDAFKLSKPNYTGKLYIIPYGAENYVSFPTAIKNGNIFATSSTAWNEIAILPDNLNTPQWEAPKDVLLLAFIDESNSSYHNTRVSNGFAAPQQPTATFLTDYSNFKEDYTNHYEYFKAALYPIVQSTTGAGGALVLQALAALKGKLLSQQEINNTNTVVDVSLLLSENPYIGYPLPNTTPQEYLEPLENFGWTGFYDKVTPASEVFTGTQFKADLDNLVNDSESASTIEVRYEPLVKVELEDKEYFEDASWTLAYDPLKQSWISYYSFTPNYYIAHNNYFQTGVKDKGLWSHNLTNKSFRVFYGDKHDSSVVFATKTDLKETKLNSVSFKSDTKRYHDEYDFAYRNDVTWDKATIWSTKENSGNLNLVPQKTLSQIPKYPIKRSSIEQDILITNSEDLWSFDYFWNRVKSNSNNQPIWKKDINDIGKEINPKAVSMNGKKVLETLSGTAFNVMLTYSGDTRYEVDLQWVINNESN